MVIKNMISNKNKITELLSKQDLISSEVSKKLGIKIDNVHVYLYDLLKVGKIQRINDKKPFIYRAITPLAYLKQLYEFMSDEKKCELKNYTELDKELMIKIDEFIK